VYIHIHKTLTVTPQLLDIMKLLFEHQIVHTHNRLIPNKNCMTKIFNTVRKLISYGFHKQSCDS